MSNLKKKKEKEEERWSKGLPEDILQLIPQRLCISDYRVFRQVCPNWRAAVDRGIATKTCPPAPQFPWLLHKCLSSLNGFYIEHQYSLVTDPRFFRSAYSCSTSPDCVGSIGAWLIIAAKDQYRHNNNNITIIDNFLLNPVSWARVMLPSQSTINRPDSSHTLFFKKVVASSPPTSLKQQQQDLIVAGLGCGVLAVCRPTDTSWTVITIRKGLLFRDIEIIDGKLYAVTTVNELMIYDILPAHVDVYRDERLVVLSNDPVRLEWGWGRAWVPYLVKDSASKELFMIIHKISFSQKKRGLFRVFKREFDTDGGARWEEVVDLGDRILFLSGASNKFIHDKTLGKNCIYFAFNDDDFGVHSLTNRTIKPLALPEGYTNNIHCANNRTLWFTPHPW
ncbi:putative F-box domain-containing protein [Rosa chinensis]|uniref:Putative F-box domain-containing protein n=1 Tax=Rosa chinensis TaxID=74649 RepID=A0A2P6S407_ROSCH|nr:putative F-box protein At5g66830 [Rosa chinensis]PRQ53409.1 putative F-box domain-containing protein [Rosa chinensis]